MADTEIFTGGGIAVEYRLTGAAGRPVILFVHGLGSDLRQFQRQHEHFSGDYRVLSVNLRGHGRSGLPGPAGVSAASGKQEVPGGEHALAPEDFALDALAADIVALLDHLAVKKVHFVGNSLGGNVGYELLGNAEERLLSFTTFGTTAKLRTPPLMLAATRLSYRAMSVGTLAKLAGRSVRNPQARSLVVEMLSSARKESILNLLPNIGTFSYLDALAGSSVPAMIIRGAHDKEINRVLESTITAFQKRGSFRLVEFPNAGHFANLDCPEEFNPVVGEFLRQLK